jgi:hypothetical protein
MAAARASGVTEVPNILKGFVELFARNGNSWPSATGA